MPLWPLPCLASAAENTNGASQPPGARDTSTVTTTQSASIARKFLGAAECAKPEFKSDQRCDWYFDPMREAEPGFGDAGKM